MNVNKCELCGEPFKTPYVYVGKRVPPKAYHMECAYAALAPRRTIMLAETNRIEQLQKRKY